MATKKAPVKKSPAKKVAAKKSTKTSAKKAVKLESFKLVPEVKPFMSFRITRQTVYWSALLIFILITQIWILNIQLDVIQTLDSLNAT